MSLSTTATTTTATAATTHISQSYFVNYSTCCHCCQQQISSLRQF
jgi:hypothetical protein